MNTSSAATHDPVGGEWLIREHGLEMVASLPVSSYIGGRRQTFLEANKLREIFPAAARPPATLRAHLTYHLKHEGAHLELLSRLFAKIGPAPIQEWIRDEPTGQYARRTGFLFEWLRGGQVLDVDTTRIGGNYVDALDSDRWVTATSSAMDKRWRVYDNMPGSAQFCPMIRLTPASQAAMGFDCFKAISGLEREFGAAALLKSAVWLSMRESRASFQIEGELDKKDRIERFADVIDRYTGAGSAAPLDEKSLAALQEQILGPSRSIQKLGLRTSPVFVGQVVHYREHVHYVAPPPSDVPDMLKGLQMFLERTPGAAPVMRAAAAAFGFVYIHPMADGNGRVHRFLINDILRRDKSVPAPFVIPISGLITRSSQERGGYDAVLDSFSKPFMARYSAACHFSKEITQYDDGVQSNFTFDALPDARHAWRFPDLTEHVTYASRVIYRAINEEMRDEAHYLRSHERAKEAVKNVIEMPDAQIDRLIRSVQANPSSAPSNAIIKQIPMLADASLWADVLNAVRDSFRSQDDAEGNPEEGFTDPVVP